jgi:predicted metal-dependent peptidase
MDIEQTRRHSSDDDAAGTRARLEQALFDLGLAREIQARLESDRAQLGQRIAALEADRGSLRKRIDERQRYIDAVHSSVAWKIVQKVRGLFGRKW